MSLELPVKIVSISFDEEYPGATFEFFGSEKMYARGEKYTKVLIKGTRDEINKVDFKNDRSFQFYGLKVKEKGKGQKYASVKNFEFYVKGECL